LREVYDPDNRGRAAACTGCRARDFQFCSRRRLGNCDAGHGRFTPATEVLGKLQGLSASYGRHPPGLATPPLAAAPALGGRSRPASLPLDDRRRSAKLWYTPAASPGDRRVAAYVCNLGRTLSGRDGGRAGPARGSRANATILPDVEPPAGHSDARRAVPLPGSHTVLRGPGGRPVPAPLSRPTCSSWRWVAQPCARRPQLTDPDK